MFQLAKHNLSIHDVLTGAKIRDIKGKYESIHVVGETLVCTTDESVITFGHK